MKTFTLILPFALWIAASNNAQEELPEKLVDCPETEQAGKTLQEAHQLIQFRDFDAAIAKAELAAELYRKGQGPNTIYACSALDAKGLALLYKTGDYAQTLPIAQHCLQVREKALGKNHPYVIMSLESLAATQMGVQRWNDAVVTLERLVTIYKTTGGPRDPRHIAALGHLADAQQMAGRAAKAKDIRQQAARIQARPVTALTLEEAAAEVHSLRNLPCEQRQPYYDHIVKLLGKKQATGDAHLAMDAYATCLRGAGKTQEALVVMQSVAQEYARILKTNDPTRLVVLDKLYGIAVAAGREDLAVVFMEDSLRMTAEIYGPQSEQAMRSTINLGFFQKERGAYARALPLLQEGRRWAHQEGKAVEEARLFSAEGEVRRELGDYDVARQLYAQGLEVLGRLPAAETVADRGSLLQNQALALKQAGVLPEAEKQYRQVLAMEEQALGPDALDLSYPLNNLGELLRDQARFDEAAPLYERCLNIRLKHLGHDHPDTATVIQNKALLAINRGHDAEAYALFEEALAIYEAALPADHPLLANTRRNLAHVFRERGDHVRAETLIKATMATEAKMLGPDHPWVAETHTQLGLLYMDMGRGEDAIREFNDAFSLRERRLGPEHPDTLSSLINQGEMMRMVGDNANAARLTERAKTGLEKIYGANHPLVAVALNNLAVLKSDAGDHAGSEALFRQAMALREKALGPDHPQTTQTIFNLVHTLAQLQRLDDAATLAQDWSNRRNRHFQRALGAGSERDRVLAAQSLSAEMYELASIHGATARNHPGFTRALATETLRSKGRALDAMAATLSALRERLDPRDRELLDTLTALKSRYATSFDSMTPEQAGFLGRKLDETERQLALRSAQFQLEQLVVDVDTVTSALPRDAALVEFLEFSPKMEGQLKDRHLAALVLRNGQALVWEDLGTVVAVQDAVRALRGQLEDPQRPDTAPAARALHALVLAPVEKHLKDTTLLLLSPMPDMQSLPWVALQDAQGRALVERFAVVVVGSGRDVLRFQALGGRSNKSLVLANPDFGKVTQDGDNTRGAKRGLRNTEFVPLPGTAQEAKAVGPLIKDARTLTGRNATEDALKQAQSPRILHVATHGFFMGDQEEATAAAPATRSRGLTLRKGEVKEPEPPPPEPYLEAWTRSGLALSNANSNTANGKQDGVVTALEMSAVNLWGTRLVVLSACQTGLGTVVHGEGVLGLRRAVTLAGAQSQVMSLWNVDDDATRDLMVAFYKNLSKGMGRAQALQQAQLTLLRSPRYKHPYYWSAFTFGGDWRPLQ